MSVENGKPGFEEAAAERELEELRRAIEESRRRRRRANDAFDEFLKGFGGSRRAAAPSLDRAWDDPEPVEGPAPEAAIPAAPWPEPPDREPVDEGMLAFSPAPSPAPLQPAQAGPEPDRGTAGPSPLDDFALEGTPPASQVPRPIPAALAPARRSPPRRTGPVLVVAALGGLAAFYAWRGRTSEDPATPATAVVSPPAPAPAPPPPAALREAQGRPEPGRGTAVTSGSQTAPLAEISATRRVWMRVTVDGARMVEREVPEGTTIPVRAGSEIVIRAGDAGAVRVSIAGKDQGPLGPAGQAATRSFLVPKSNR